MIEISVNVGVGGIVEFLSAAIQTGKGWLRLIPCASGA